MHIQVKLFLVALVSAVCSTTQAELVWEQTQLELHPAISDDVAVGHFKYQNKGDKPVAIKSVTTSCDCTAASAKQSAEPGEKGEVTATFKIGDRTGVQQKMITVVTDDIAHPSTSLNLKVDISVVLELQPTFIYWQAGEPAKSKAIFAKAGAGVSIKSLDVSSSHPDFVTKVDRGAGKDEFRINVEPRQTTQPVAATLTIKPVLEKGQKIFYASVRVMPPTATNAPPANSVQATTPTQPVRSVSSAKSKIDACALLTSKEIESIQGEPLRDTKASGKSTGGLAVSQCYFTLPTSSNSISLTVMRKGDGADARDPEQYWKETFRRVLETGKERDEEKKKSESLQKIAGVGDEAFWSGDRVGGELYVLKGNSYIKISVGGSGDQASKIKKSKALAEIVLKRL